MIWMRRQIARLRLCWLESKIRDDHFDKALSLKIDRALVRFESLGGRR